MMVRCYHQICEPRFFHPATIDGLIRTWFEFMNAKPAQERIPIAIAAGGELNQHNRRDTWLEAVDYLWQTFASRPSSMRVSGKPACWCMTGFSLSCLNSPPRLSNDHAAIRLDLHTVVLAGEQMPAAEELLERAEEHLDHPP
jgi:hypothetical protein